MKIHHALHTLEQFVPGGDWHHRNPALQQRTALEDAEELLVTRHRAKAKAKDAVARGVAEAAAKAHNLAYIVEREVST